MQVAVVAGGSGFIGSHLCRKLLQKDLAVICVDNLITGSQANITDLQAHPHFQFIRHDVSMPLEITPKEGPISYVFHLASPASPNMNSKRSYINYPLETLQVNSVGTTNLLAFSRKHTARFLFASTSEVYGDPTISPQPETYFGNVNPNGIRSVYDEAKRFGEAVTMAYHRTYGLDVRIVRIFNTYGPFMQPDDGRVVANFITQALAKKPITIYGDGNQTRSFCYIDDMVEALVAMMFSDKTKAEVVNVGNPTEHSVRQLAEMIQKMTKTSSEIVYEDLPQDDPKQRKPDIQKAMTLLEWHPSISIETGLTKTIEYFAGL